MATKKQKEVAKKMVEVLKKKGGKIILGEVLKEVGYSDAVAKTPQKVTETKGFQEIMAEAGLTDKELTQKHYELLSAHKIDYMAFPGSLSDQEVKGLLIAVGCTAKKIKRDERIVHVWFWSPDNRARKDALDMAYKIKGTYAPEKRANLNVNLNTEVKEQKKIDKITEKYEEDIKKILIKG